MQTFIRNECPEASQEQMNFLDLQEQFYSEEACHDHLYNMRWPNGFQRPGAGMSILTRLYLNCNQETALP